MPKPSDRDGCSKTSASATTCVERQRRDTDEPVDSLSHIDGAAVAWRRADAIDANLKFRNLQKQTLSQHRQGQRRKRLELDGRPRADLARLLRDELALEEVAD